ncbi:MAG: hypothetical protein ACYDGN_01820 [Acidimicrobiales bacterium]
MSCEIWEEKVLRAPGARERVNEIEGELRVAAGQDVEREKTAPSNSGIDTANGHRPRRRRSD